MTIKENKWNWGKTWSENDIHSMETNSFHKNVEEILGTWSKIFSHYKKLQGASRNLGEIREYKRNTK